MPAALLLTLLAATPGAPGGEETPADWADFRGGGNSVTDATDLPLEWSAGEGVAWELGLPGVGQSAAVVAGGRAYVTGVDGPNKETLLVSAVDPAAGTLLWAKRLKAGRTSPNDFMHSRAAPTPCADSRGVVVFFASGDLIALTPAGEERWRRDLAAEFGPFENRHDLGTSPAQDGDKLYLQLDHGGPSATLLAVDKGTGETVWATPREPRTSFTSPVAATLGGVPQVVCSSNGSVDGYDAATGARLWTVGGLSGNTIPSPVASGDRVFVGAKPGRRGEGIAEAQASNCCIKVTPPAGDGDDGDGWTAGVVWRAPKTLSHYASPLVHRGRAYYLNNVGVVTCVDAATGALLHRGRLGFECWATPIGAGDRVYCFGRGGEAAVLEAADAFTVLAENNLTTLPPPPEKPGPAAGDGPRGRGGAGGYDGPFVYGATPVPGGFLVRTESVLYRVGG